MFFNGKILCFSRQVLSIPGGKFDTEHPWSAFPPDTCCEKLTLLLKYLLQPDGSPPNMDPFVIPSMENTATKKVVQDVHNAWLNQASVTTDTLKTFYDLVMGRHKMPYITTMGGKAVSFSCLFYTTNHR